MLDDFFSWLIGLFKWTYRYFRPNTLTEQKNVNVRKQCAKNPDSSSALAHTLHKPQGDKRNASQQKISNTLKAIQPKQGARSNLDAKTWPSLQDVLHDNLPHIRDATGMMETLTHDLNSLNITKRNKQDILELMLTATTAEQREVRAYLVKQIKREKPGITSTIGHKAVFACIRKDNPDALQYLLETWPETAIISGPNGQTPLMQAAEQGQTKTFNLLLEHHDHAQYFDAQNTDGNTALILAMQKNHTECIEALLAKGADPWFKNRVGQSAYTLALKDSKMAMILLQHPIFLEQKHIKELQNNIKNDGAKLIGYALDENDINVANRLICAGAPIPDVANSPSIHKETKAWLKKRSALEEEYKALKQSIHQQETAIHKTQSAITQQVAILDNVNLQMSINTSLQTQLKKSQANISNLESRLKRSSQKRKRLEKELPILKSQMSDLKKNLEEWRRDTTSMAKHLVSDDTQQHFPAAEYDFDLMNREISDVRQDIELIAQKITTVEKKQKKIRKQLQQEQAKIKAITNQHSPALHTTQTEQKQRLEKLRKDVKKLRTTLTTDKERLSSLEAARTKVPQTEAPSSEANSIRP